MTGTTEDKEIVLAILKEMNELGWTLTSSDIRYNNWKYDSKNAIVFMKKEDEVHVETTISNDRKFAIIHVKPSENDNVYRVAELPYNASNIDITSNHIIKSYSVTLEQIREQYDTLKYFDKDLNMIDKDILVKSFADDEIKMQLVLEMMFVNKLQTISRNYAWERENENRPFHKGLFKRQITAPGSLADEFGNIKGWGMKLTLREWDLYKALHDELFEIKDIEDESHPF